MKNMLIKHALLWGLLFLCLSKCVSSVLWIRKKIGLSYRANYQTCGAVMQIMKSRWKRTSFRSSQGKSSSKNRSLLYTFLVALESGKKIASTHSFNDILTMRSWLTDCHSNLFSFRGMIALKRRDSVDLETTTYQVDRALRDRRKKLVKRNTIADFYKHDPNSDTNTAGEYILITAWLLFSQS